MGPILPPLSVEELTELQKEDRRRLTRLETEISSLKGAVLRVPVVSAILLLVAGALSPMFSWEAESVLGNFYTQNVELFSGGLTFWVMESKAAYGEWIVDSMAFSIAALVVTAALVVSVFFLISISSRNVGRLWNVLGRIATVLMGIGIAWLALLVWRSDGQYTPKIGLALLAGGVFTTCVAVFGMRRYWDEFF